MLMYSCRFYVVQPSKVEIPKSMASVAVAWNLPMHYWLKTCEFIVMSTLYYLSCCTTIHMLSRCILHNCNIRSCKLFMLNVILKSLALNAPYKLIYLSDVYKKTRTYGVFVAAFMTYAASSVLHVSGLT